MEGKIAVRGRNVDAVDAAVLASCRKSISGEFPNDEWKNWVAETFDVPTTKWFYNKFDAKALKKICWFLGYEQKCPRRNFKKPSRVNGPNLRIYMPNRDQMRSLRNEHVPIAISKEFDPTDHHYHLLHPLETLYQYCIFDDPEMVYLEYLWCQCKTDRKQRKILFEATHCKEAIREFHEHSLSK